MLSQINFWGEQQINYTSIVTVQSLQSKSESNMTSSSSCSGFCCSGACCSG